MRTTLLALVCAASPVMVQAQTYEAVNRLAVVPINSSSFEVIEARGEGARGIWCAAADFSAKRLGRSGRIYVKSPLGQSITGKGRKGVVFTTDANAVNARQSYSVSVRQKGQGLPVAHAIQFCKDYLIELEDRVLFRKVNP